MDGICKLTDYEAARKAIAKHQESEAIPSDILNAYFAPYMGEVSAPFGLAYYACCETIHDRLQHIEKAIPNLRAVSVSGWNDFHKAGEMIADK